MIFKEGDKVVIDTSFSEAPGILKTLADSNMVTYADRLRGKSFTIYNLGERFQKHSLYGPVYLFNDVRGDGYEYWVQEHLLIKESSVKGACNACRAISMRICGYGIFDTRCDILKQTIKDVEKTLDLNRLKGKVLL